MDLMRAGGAPMWAIVLFGGLSLLLGGRFALRPDKRALPVLAALAVSVLCSIMAGTLADLAAVGVKIPAHRQWAESPHLPLLVLEGIAESMSPGILGFSMLALVALECAVGLRRLAHMVER
jgi:hypothetical protein